MAVCSEFCTTDWVKMCIRRTKAALVGLEKLSDSDAATYLNAHPQAIDFCGGMPHTFTAAMITEARTTVI